EPEESWTLDSGDARDSGELGDFVLVVSEELERSCVLQGEDHGGYIWWILGLRCSLPIVGLKEDIQH
ncbi:hypothetical protein A2U01_0066214, partial [Trifolium medium]|nr:hypothetical protein [Trifolium medium]